MKTGHAGKWNPLSSIFLQGLKGVWSLVSLWQGRGKARRLGPEKHLLLSRAESPMPQPTPSKLRVSP